MVQILFNQKGEITMYVLIKSNDNIYTTSVSTVPTVHDIFENVNEAEHLLKQLKKKYPLQTFRIKEMPLDEIIAHNNTPSFFPLKFVLKGTTLYFLVFAKSMSLAKKYLRESLTDYNEIPCIHAATKKELYDIAVQTENRVIKIGNNYKKKGR